MSEDRKINKKMLERLIIIHNAIKSGIYPNNKKLRTLYCDQTGYEKVGEATIARDIETLRVRFNAPLEYDPEKRGYYYLDDNWEFALNNISSEDVFYLSSAKTLLSNFKGTPIYNEIADVIDFITDTQMVGKTELIKRIAIPPAPKVIIDENIWSVILKCLQNNEILEFEYNGRWHSETSLRRVQPYQILLNDGMYFLFGWDENANNKKGGERMFCLTRMKNVQKTGCVFELPESYDFESRCKGGKFGIFAGKSVEQYVIEFYDIARMYVKDCIWAEDQVITDDDSCNKTTISFSSAQSVRIMEWVLAQGCNAKPIAPENFVNWWKNEIQGMMKNAGL